MEYILSKEILSKKEPIPNYRIQINHLFPSNVPPFLHSLIKPVLSSVLCRIS
nr:MAG TPA: hypothetical protein [Caudoviricetes sp.]